MKLEPHFKLNIYKASRCLFCLGFLTDINLFAIQQCHKVLACSNPLNAHALELTKDVFADDFFEPFNSHEWPRQNFSLHYQYNINQISDENKEKY